MSFSVPNLPFSTENEDTVRARMNANVAPDWAQDEGTVLATFREIGVSEVALVWNALNSLFLQLSPTTATGDFLDAWAASYGLQRSLGTPAQGLVRFIGPGGLFIPSGTIVGIPSSDPSTPPVVYQTTNVVSVQIQSAQASGAQSFVDIAAQAVNPGADGNCAVGAIAYLETNLFSPTPVQVTNPTPFIGGSDPEDDNALRQRVMTQVELPVGSGTVADYVAWGLQIPGIGRVDVTPLWDTSGPSGLGSTNGTGSVGISVRDIDAAPVDWGLVQQAQSAIDPSRALIAITEPGESWTLAPGSSASASGAVAFNLTRQQVGFGSLALSSAGAGLVVAQLAQSEDLSRFGQDDLVRVWVYCGNWANVLGSQSFISFIVSPDQSSYFLATMSQTSSPGSPMPSSGSGWWEWVVSKAQFQGVVGSAPLDWAAVSQVQLGVYLLSAQEVDFDYMRFVSLQGAAGYGLAPVGAAATIFTPTVEAINVTASVRLSSGFTLTGAVGTANATLVIQNAISAYLSQLAPGATVLAAGIEDAIYRAQGVTNVVLAAPSADTPVSTLRYPVLGALNLTLY